MSTTEQSTSLLAKLRHKITGESEAQRAEREAESALFAMEVAREKSAKANAEAERPVAVIDGARFDGSEQGSPKIASQKIRDGAPAFFGLLGMGSESHAEMMARKEYEVDAALFESGELDARIARGQIELKDARVGVEMNERRVALGSAMSVKCNMLQIAERIRIRNFWFSAVAVLALPASAFMSLMADPGLALLLIPAAALWARLTTISIKKTALPLALILAAAGMSRLSGGGAYFAYWWSQAFAIGLFGLGVLSFLARGNGDLVKSESMRVVAKHVIPRRYRGRWNALTLLIAFGAYFVPFAYEYAAPWNYIAAKVGIPGADALPLPVARRSVTVEFRRMIAASESNKARMELEDQLVNHPSLVKFSALDGGGWTAIYPKAFFALLGPIPKNYNTGPIWVNGPASGNPGDVVTQSPQHPTLPKPKR